MPRGGDGNMPVEVVKDGTQEKYRGPPTTDGLKANQEYGNGRKGGKGEKPRSIEKAENLRQFLISTTNSGQEIGLGSTGSAEETRMREWF